MTEAITFFDIVVFVVGYWLQSQWV